MKLKPFAEIIKLSKEKKDELLAPMRARGVKAKAELEMAKMDEQLVTLESAIQEQCTEKEIDFDALIKKIDEHALVERRKKQYQKILDELFPA